jgi:hypothetical protein
MTIGQPVIFGSTRLAFIDHSRDATMLTAIQLVQLSPEGFCKRMMLQATVIFFINLI